MARNLALILYLVSATASMDEDTSCNACATEKWLAAAVKTSFLKEFEKDAAATCGAAVAEKKRAYAAKDSFDTNCEKYAVG